MRFSWGKIWFGGFTFCNSVYCLEAGRKAVVKFYHNLELGWWHWWWRHWWWWWHWWRWHWWRSGWGWWWWLGSCTTSITAPITQNPVPTGRLQPILKHAPKCIPTLIACLEEYILDLFGLTCCLTIQESLEFELMESQAMRVGKWEVNLYGQPDSKIGVFYTFP